GPGVYIRTRLAGISGGTSRGSAGTGCRRWMRVLLRCASGLARALVRASPRSPHPNRFVWQWVEIWPVRSFGAGMSALRWIFRWVSPPYWGFKFANRSGRAFFKTGVLEGRREMSTFIPSGKNIDRKWFVVDASGKTLGR